MSEGRPATLGALRASGYRSLPVRAELRRNLRRKLAAGETLFPGVLGYDRTVIPGIVNAILAGHDLILLGLRGQAKTRLLRSLTGLLDPEILRRIANGGELDRVAGLQARFLAQLLADSRLERLVEAAAGYDEFDLPVVPAFEFIVTVAQGSPGADGRYTLARPAEEVRPYLDGVRQVGGIVVLDLQPGQAAFLDQAQQYAELLMEPDVHLALDPEWSMDPGQVPGQVFGDTDGATVNQVATWLQELVIRHGLPQKTLIVHQFLAGMVDDRDLVVDPEGIAVMFHIDGQGPVGAKFGTYDQLSVQPPFFNGFKVFFDEDSRVMEPAEVMTVDPAPVYVSYQ